MPIIYGAPLQKSDNDLTAIQRYKRQIISDDDDSVNFLDSNEYLTVPEPELVFEGLLGLKNIFRKIKNSKFILGCKYDANVCNENEACFDGELLMNMSNKLKSLSIFFLSLSIIQSLGL